ncbi:MAG: zeta toxin family protein [Burkholderiales bacterium]|nr:zeta toxin family protein [Burkholderiales bacterium]
MTSIAQAVEEVRREQRRSKKPLAVILAGHNGSGKSTMWLNHLSAEFQIPLVNADRMMLSVLPESKRLPKWAQELRDTNTSWMAVAQKGVEAFVAQAMSRGVPFAMETVFSHWRSLGDGRFESKIDLIKQMQDAGYFVLLFFVGLSNVQLSIARVSTRVAQGGHAVDEQRLLDRFPRTQKAIGLAAFVADATIFTDNSRSKTSAFTLCRIQIRSREIYDIRKASNRRPPRVIAEWLDVLSPR